MIFLVENKDTYCNVDRLLAMGETTDYCVRMVIILSSIDESLIQAHEYSILLISRFSISFIFTLSRGSIAIQMK